MKIRIAMGVFVLCSLIPAHAQQAGPAVIAEGGRPDDRASARVLYWNRAERRGVGEFAIDYGRPVWKPAYDDQAKFDQMTKGRTWRTGSNFWTTLDTFLPLKIAGKDVPVGYYYLGLHRSADGSNWSLAFIDPATVRAGRIDAVNIDKAPISFEAPMSMATVATKADKLTIELSYAKEDMRKVTLTINWGTLALTAPIEVSVSE